MAESINKPERLEFGNPEHIKKAAIGYQIAEALDVPITADLEHDSFECDQCNGTGEIESYTCGNCGAEGDDPDEILITEWNIKHRGFAPELLGRCSTCFAILNHK